MSQQDAFERILASLSQTTWDPSQLVRHLRPD